MPKASGRSPLTPGPLLPALCEIVPIGLWPPIQKPEPSVQTPWPHFVGTPLCRPNRLVQTPAYCTVPTGCFAPTPGPSHWAKPNCPLYSPVQIVWDKLLPAVFCPLYSSLPTGRSPNSILLFLILRPLYRRPWVVGEAHLGPLYSWLRLLWAAHWPGAAWRLPPSPSPLHKWPSAARASREGGVHAARRAGQPSEPKSRPNLTWARALKKGPRHSVPRPPLISEA